MANVYVGDSKKLVFPVMCDGHIKLEYDDTNISTSKGNFWNHTGNFVLEAIITPYDVNGNGHATTANLDTLTSTKTPPSPNLSLDNHADTTSNYQSVLYFGDTRFSRKMMIFYNEYFQLYLENTTKNNFNQPAEYKIVAKIRDATSGLYHEVATETLIKPVNTLYGYYDADGLYNDNSTSLTELQGDTSPVGNQYPNDIQFPTGSDGVANVASLAAHATGGTELFNSNGESVGRVTAKPMTNTVTVTNIANHTAKIYVSQPREAMYVDTIYKISCVYYSGGQLDIYLNNSLKKSYTFSTTPTFEFKADDSYICGSIINNSQFMGELYEISLSKGKEPSVTDTTLTPSYSNIFFYYTFGE